MPAAANVVAGVALVMVAALAWLIVDDLADSAAASDRSALISAMFQADGQRRELAALIDTHMTWPELRRTLEASGRLESAGCVARSLCLCALGSDDPADCSPVAFDKPPDVRANSIGSLIAQRLLDVTYGPKPGGSRTGIVVVGAGHGATPIAQLIVDPPRSIRLASAQQAIGQRIPLYAAALFAPLALALLAGWGSMRLHLSRVARERDHAERAQMMAEYARQRAQRALAEVGHEVMSPVASALALVALWRAAGWQVPDKLAAAEQFSLGDLEVFLKRIASAGRRLRGLLQASQASIDTPASTQLEINAFLARAIRAQRALGGVEYRLIPAAKASRVAADEGLLEQIFGNLFDNAARFAAGQPVTVRVESDDAGTRVIVRNQGPIVTRGDEERIFESGVSLDPSRAEAFQGLGLAIARDAALAINAEITVINDPEPATHGVSFVVTFHGSGGFDAAPGRDGLRQ